MKCCPPIRTGGFTATKPLYSLLRKPVNTCLVTLCVARDVFLRYSLRRTTRNKKPAQWRVLFVFMSVIRLAIQLCEANRD